MSGLSNRLNIIKDSLSEETVKSLHQSFQRRLDVGQISNCPVEQCLAFVRMCLAESCGKCVPCRVGLKQMAILLEGILDGSADADDVTKLRELAATIGDSADCAIGFGAANEVAKAIDAWREDFDSHVKSDRCTAEFRPVPCKAGCPAHVDIPGYIALTKAGKYADAVRLIRYDNPLVASCALVCEHPCEAACRRRIIDDAINIRAIKRMAVDNAGVVPAPECLADTGKKIAVIGGGPSGLTVAYYLRLMGHSVDLFEQRKKLGGMMRYGIPRYRLPDKYLDSDIDMILSTGVNAKTDCSIGADEYKEMLDKYDAVYLSIGAHNANSLGIEGDTAENVLSAVTLLRMMGDGEPVDFKGKRVVIVGGGNVAMDCTRTAKRLGASDVKCVYRRRRQDMTALDEEIDGAVAEACELVTMKAPVRVEVDSEGKVAALIVQQQLPGEYDRGRPRPVKAELPEERIECDIIISAIGQSIDSAPFESAGLPAKRNRFVADSGCRIEGKAAVYVGGDCMSGPATVIRAVEAGKTAAANIDKELGFNHVLTRDIKIPPAAPADVKQCGRIGLAERAAKERAGDFGIMEQEMTMQECQQECGRCLRCDHHGMGAMKGGRAQW